MWGTARERESVCVCVKEERKREREGKREKGKGVVSDPSRQKNKALRAKSRLGRIRRDDKADAGDDQRQRLVAGGALCYREREKKSARSEDGKSLGRPSRRWQRLAFLRSLSLSNTRMHTRTLSPACHTHVCTQNAYGHALQYNTHTHESARGPEASRSSVGRGFRARTHAHTIHTHAHTHTYIHIQKTHTRAHTHAHEPRTNSDP